MIARTIRAAAVVAALAGLSVAGAGCSSPEASADGKLAVVATTTQVADFARAIGGDKVAVTQILKANVDPHDYEPSPADITAFGTAKLVVKNGVDLEKNWLDKTIQSAGFKGTVVDTSQGVTLLKGEGEDGKEEDDHDAFSYYVDRYKIEYVGAIIPSFDTSAELSGKEIEELVKKIKETGVKAIFSESSLPPKTAETIGQQAGVKVVAGEDALYADTLGPEGSAGDTYLKAMAHNTDEIVKALA